MRTRKEEEVEKYEMEEEMRQRGDERGVDDGRMGEMGWKGWKWWRKRRWKERGGGDATAGGDGGGGNAGGGGAGVAKGV